MPGQADGLQPIVLPKQPCKTDFVVYCPINYFLLYSILKIWVRLSTKIFCNRIVVNKPELLKSEGPLLLACNHPNSFLDAVLLDILFEKPIWSLARGDVFKKPFYIRLLHKLKILPVYRTREGVENLEENYRTFNTCKELFKRNGVVLIFSEGLCVNEWHLRPLKKGTARLAFSTWQDGTPLKVLPVGINYSSFSRIGKNVFINFGEIIESSNFNLNDADGKNNVLFNQQLESQLRQLVFEIPIDDYAVQKQKLEIPVPLPMRALLFIPAMVGYFLNAPFYLPVRAYTRKRVRNTDHFDSVMLALLTFIYPLYLIIVFLLLFLFTGYWFSLFLFLLFPITTWCFIKWKSKTG